MLAAFAALAAVPDPVAAAVTLGPPTVRPPYFTPDGDGRNDSTELSFVPGADGDSVGVRVEVRRASDAALVDTPRPLANVPSGAALVTVWSPGPIAEGGYRFEILVTDGMDSVTDSVTVVVDLTPPVVSLGAVAPNPFDPAAPSPADSLRAPITVVGDATTGTVVRILTEAGSAVKTLGSFPGSGDAVFTWDGKGAADAIQPTGRYLVRAVATDLAGNADTTAQAFVLDREAPLFPAGVDTVQTDAMPFIYRGTALDLDRVVLVETSVDSGATFRAVDSLSAPAASVQWATSVDYPGATPGFRRLVVRARDAAGHTARDTVVVAFDDAIPAALGSTVLGDGTVRDGGTVRIRTEWSLSGLDVSANFSALDFDYVADRETVVENPPGTYTITYRVSPSNIRRAQAHDVTIRASTGIVAGRDTVSVTLEEGGPRADELVAVSRNRFDPDAGETVTIAADRGTVGVSVTVANLAGQIVRELEGVGFVEWDGRGQDGGICGSGVYFLRAKVEGDTENRRVAVLRGGGS